MSSMVLQWAVEQTLFKFTPTEIGNALDMLPESEEFGNGDVQIGLQAFNDVDEITSTYITPYRDKTGAPDPKQIPFEKRVEALARILITVSEELNVLTDQYRSDEEGQAFYAQRKGPTEERIRSLNDMPYFGLPDIPFDRLQDPELGPLEFNGRKEHVCETWTRILTLLRYANTRVSKSKYNMAGCIDSEKQRNELSRDAQRKLIDQGGRKWLGLDEDWSEPFLELPAWMRPTGMDVDKTREIKEKDPNQPAQRPIKFEAVWLEDFPGESPELGPKCKQFWADKGLREEFGIPDHVKAPEFAFPGRRPTARDPRDFPDYSLIIPNRGTVCGLSYS
ncbi:hypothetical protein KVR01_005340 [Diaporthe batatas]|uniref:uncharacterized protein n=1 Tax=Diaporthe batatas TaxID=748121 RepID=UPI001D03B45A|nr:uncharacterized protein KVR01_005340 [Diaporthe batatas]KAG8165065.1 hypothetical protein KVR01_005340 [Diaporthe batatas]